MRYNITRLVREIVAAERAMLKKRGEYDLYQQRRQVLSYELNSLRSAKSLLNKHIATEVVERVKNGESLDDWNKLEEDEQIAFVKELQSRKDL